jgi:hypothetical protein
LIAHRRAPRALWLAPVVVLSLAACSGTKPTPLPGGPPPEYEPARGYDGGAGDAPAAPEPENPGAPAEPAAAPDAGAPPAAPAPPMSWLRRGGVLRIARSA